MRLRKLFFEPDHGDGDSFRASHDIVTGLVMALRSDKAGWRLHLHPDGPGSQPRQGEPRKATHGSESDARRGATDDQLYNTAAVAHMPQQRPSEACGLEDGARQSEAQALDESKSEGAVAHGRDAAPFLILTKHFDSGTETPQSQSCGLKHHIPYLLCAAPPMGTGGARPGPAKRALDERRFTPPNIEARAERAERYEGINNLALGEAAKKCSGGRTTSLIRSTNDPQEPCVRVGTNVRTAEYGN